MDALVSVVIPTYNHAHFLGRALQSVLDQTYPHWEALVIDNHSQDNTYDVIKSFGDPRIRLLRVHNHGVIATSRNLGMRAAKGEWIAFLDSDDCWYPKKLETIMAVIELDDTYDVLSTDKVMVNIETGTKKILRFGPDQEDLYNALLVEGNRLATSATVVRRDFLVRHGLAFDELPDYITVEDYGLWLNLARTGARFKFIHEVQGELTKHGSNSSAQLSRHLTNGETLLHHHVFTIQEFQPARDKLWEQVLPRLRYLRCRQLVAMGRRGAAFKLALETLNNSPRSTAMFLLATLKKHLKRMFKR